MKNLTFLLSVILLIACAAVAVAQPVTFSSRQKGNLLGAAISVTGESYIANLNIAPYTSDQAVDAYLISWSNAVFGGPIPPPPTCVSPTNPPPPLPPPMVSTNVVGTVPLGSIKVSASGELSIDLDISKLQTVLYASRIDCTGGPCISSYPVSFPVRGTFTRMTTGVGASTFSNSGNRETVNVDPLCTTTSSFSGADSGGTANFTGIIGTITIAPPPLGANASMHVQKGQLRLTSVCTPPPPPI